MASFPHILFYVPARQSFVPAGELKAGDQLVSHDGRLISIASVCSTEAVTTVYNLRVADHYTYFAGGSIWGWDVWVHNARAYDLNATLEALASQNDYTRRVPGLHHLMPYALGNQLRRGHRSLTDLDSLTHSGQNAWENAWGHSFPLRRGAGGIKWQ